MLLGGIAIRDQLVSGNWEVLRDETPISPDDLNIGPNSVDVTLNKQILICTSQELDLSDKKSGTYRAEEIPEYGRHLLPGEFILACTNERFVCDKHIIQLMGDHIFPVNPKRYFVPMLTGRSTIARMGLAVHVTAGFGDYGFNGAFTLELINLGNSAVILKPGIRIAQMFFEEVWLPEVYSGAYTGDEHRRGPVAPVCGADRV